MDLPGHSCKGGTSYLIVKKKKLCLFRLLDQSDPICLFQKIKKNVDIQYFFQMCLFKKGKSAKMIRYWTFLELLIAKTGNFIGNGLFKIIEFMERVKVFSNELVIS